MQNCEVNIKDSTLVILILGIIACSTIVMTIITGVDTYSKDIVIAIVAGLVGFLSNRHHENEEKGESI